MNPLRPYIAGLVLLVCLAATGGGGYAVYSYNRMAKQVAEIPLLEAKVKVLAEGYTTLSNEMVRHNELDAVLDARRDAINFNLDKATHEDPATAGLLRARIPQRVRDAYRTPAKP